MDTLPATSQITRHAFRQTIRHYRLQAHLTQDKLSDLMGISKRHYSRLELAQSPLTLAMLFRLAETLDVSPVEITKALIEESKKS